MMSFYDRKGPESWSQGIVPHFITCNNFIGKSYAKVISPYENRALSYYSLRVGKPDSWDSRWQALFSLAGHDA